MDHKINIQDIAKESGYSITTVSRALNGKADKFRIATKTQEKIKTIAKELNYTRNEHARILRPGQRQTIADLAPSL